MIIEDSLLIQKLKAKDEDAYVLVFKEYYPHLLSFSSHYIWDMEAAEDIVQDAFMKLYENADIVSISIKAYLFRTVRNRCLNYLRDRKVHDTHYEGIVEAMLWSDSLSVVEERDIYNDKVTLDLLGLIIQKLPERSRDIVLMRLEKEYKFSQIAAILNISENSAKVQMSRAVSFMRKEFLKYKGFDKEL